MLSMEKVLLLNIDEIKEQIRIRENLLKDMVSNLYSRIVYEEIAKLKHRINCKKGYAKGLICPKCGWILFYTKDRPLECIHPECDYKEITKSDKAEKAVEFLDALEELKEEGGNDYEKYLFYSRERNSLVDRWIKFKKGY